MPSPILLGSFDDWDGFYDYMAVYGIHLLFGAILSAVTIYRREMSCNRVFHQDDDSQKDVPVQFVGNSLISDEMEEETEELLESAGNFCSCQPIVHLASKWIDSFPCEDKDGNEKSFPSKLLQEDVTPTDLLERAGNFYSGEPIMAAVALFLWQQTNVSQTHTVSLRKGEASYDPFTNHLPHDDNVQIASFLHPKDIVALSCVSRSYRAVVDESSTSRAIWRTLWERDYAWVINSWSIGKEAFQRSALDEPYIVDKEFYFRFGQCYLNYILAGRNTTSSCVVGLHCHIYDITSFLDIHPGSPDTLMVHSGKNSTLFFEDMGHSLVARRRATKLCVLVDLSKLSRDGWGLRPTESTSLDDGDNSHDVIRCPPRFTTAGAENLLLGRKQPRNGGTLKTIFTKLENEFQELTRQLEVRFGNDPSILGNVNPYYDPFRREWRVWYTTMDLELVFCSI